MKSLVKVLPLIALLAVIGACGGGTTAATSETTSITTMDDLPRSTSPVVDAVTGNLAAIEKSLLSKAAETGIVMEDLSSTSFTANSSIAACMAANQLKQLLNAAAQGDMILCYIQNMADSFSGGDSIDLYDGHPHIFDLNISGGEEDMGPDHVKFVITRNSSDIITNFQMFECSSGSQKGYLNQTIAGTAFTMLAKGTWSGDSTGGYYTSVDGTLNTSGAFTQKSINNKNYWAQSSGAASNAGWNEGSFRQGATSYGYVGYDAGTFDDGTQDGSYSNRVYSEGQLIDGNASAAMATYDIGKIALGDGAALTIFSGEFGDASYNNGVDGEVQSWLGDTTLATDSNDYTTLVTGQTPATVRTQADIEADIAFDSTTGEDYSCNGTPDVTTAVAADDAALATACSNYQLNYQWVDCWQIIESDEQEQEGGSCDMATTCGAFQGDDNIAACQACFPAGVSDSNTFDCLTAVCPGLPTPEAIAGCTEVSAVCQ